MGLCRDKSKLKLYIFIQPLVIIIEIVISIVDFLGFNGFIRVSRMFNDGTPLPAIFGLVVSIVFLLMAAASGYVYFRICR